MTLNLVTERSIYDKRLGFGVQKFKGGDGVITLALWWITFDLWWEL